MSDFLAGCTSGVMQSIIGHPFDTIKVLQQTQRPFHTNIFHYYKGVTYPTSFNILSNGLVFDLHSRFQKRIGNHYVAGGLSGLIVGPIVYYFDVGKIHHQLSPNMRISLSQFKKINELGTTVLRESIATSFYMGIYFNNQERYGAFASGGVAGLTSWLVTYPLDVIKTRLMSNEYNSFSDALKKGNLWRGFTACAIRAVLVNSVGFWSYDRVMNI